MALPTYNLPGSEAASQALRDLQMSGTGGLASLASRDTAGKRKLFADTMYAGQEEAINKAADIERMKLLEGTFGRGVGPSSISTNLLGRFGESQRNALATARREAELAASAEDRADLASELAGYNAMFGAGTTGLQAEANVALANLAREQDESQFGRNLEFQGGENALNRAQQANLFGQDLGFKREQLAQQGSQFDKGLAFTGSENAAERALRQSMQQAGFAFTGGENAAERALRQSMQQSSQAFTGQENAAERALRQAMQSAGFAFTGGENAANRAAAQQLAQMGYDFTGTQNQLNRDFTGTQNQAARDLDRLLAQMNIDYNTGQRSLDRDFTASQNQLGRDFTGTQGQLGRDFTASQNQAARDANLAQLILQLQGQEDLMNDRALYGGLAAGAGGIGQILARIFA